MPQDHSFGAVVVWRVNQKQERKQEQQPLAECLSFRQVLLALSDVSIEFPPFSISDNDPLTIGRAAASCISKVTETSDLSNNLLLRIFSFGLAQCWLSVRLGPRGSASTWIVEGNSQSRLEPQSNVRVGRPFTIEEFTRSVCPVDLRNNSFPKRIKKLIQYGDRWRHYLDIIKETTKQDWCGVVGFICLPKFSYLWTKGHKRSCGEVLKKLSQDPTLKKTISLLALVVTRFWPWDYVRCNRQYTMARVNPSGVGLTIPTVVLSNWKEKSLEAIRSEPALRACQQSDDGAVIALLMTFAPPGYSSLEIFRRGASLRRRWTRDGHVKNQEASDYFIHPKVTDLLLDNIRIRNAWKSYQSTQFYLFPNAGYADQFRHKLPADVKLFWSYTAMVLTCGAIPWKSLTPVKIDYCASNRCLHHTVSGFTGTVDQLPDHVRLEIASSLVEASRLPYPQLRLKWREFAIDEAEKSTRGLPYCHHLHIAQARSQLKRLQGDYEGARKVLDTHNRESDVEPTASSAMRNFADGLIAIQRCLNYLQRDEISAAIHSLRAWVPGSTPMAAAVMFQSTLLLAKCLRFRGQFLESQTELTELLKVEHGNPDLDFEEYRRDWAYESAACLIEQDFPEEEANHNLLKAEHSLREELNRMKSKLITYPKDVPLQLLLAECFFAQGKHSEAEEICHNLTCELKFDQLHCQIILAKINHAKHLAETITNCLEPGELRTLRDKALTHWMAAGKLITSMSQNEGHSSLAVYLSLMNLFSHCEDTAWREARERTRRSIECTRLGQSDQGVKYWIPGLMSWKKKLSLAEPWIDQSSKL